MNWKEFRDSIKKGEYASVYIFHGEEEYVKGEMLAQLRKNLLPEGMEALNENILPSNADAEAVIEAAETLPVFCDRRIILVRDWVYLASGRAKEEAENHKRFAAWIKNAPDSCVVVVYLRGKCEKKLTDYIGAGAVEVQFDCLQGAELEKWIVKRCKGGGVTIGREAMDMLIGMAGTELTRLIGEIEKLVSYAGEGGEITTAMVRELVTPTPESTVFEMIDALTAGNFRSAREKQDALLTAGENRTYILYMITRQMRLLTLTKEMAAQGASTDKIASATGARPYGVRRMLEQVRRMDAVKLRECYTLCVDSEFGIKNGTLWDEAALDRVMLLLSRNLHA